MVEVIAAAKVDLKPGDVIDGVGGFTVYGMCENADLVARERLLPLGLSEGVRLTRGVRRDDVLGYGDVERPEGRLSDRLRAEQDAAFAHEQVAGG
jgi:predicted homoserine dehydrogenase-like protein